MSLPARCRALGVYPDHPGAVHRTEIDLPPIGDYDALIETIRVGVCGTDREIIHGAFGKPPAGTAELVIGHELLGRVLATGPAVGDLATGTIVTATVRRPDGCPACQAGYPDMCLWGTYSERGIVGLHGFMSGYVVEHRDNVIPIPTSLESVGVLAEPLTIIEKSMRQVDRIHQDRLPWWEPSRALVLGAGPIGILATMLLRSRGFEVVTAARTPKPHTAASVIEATGASYVSTREDSLTGVAGRMGNIDVILDCSGAGGLGFEGMQLLGVNGVLVLLGVNSGDYRAELPVNAINNGIVAGNKTVVGCVNAAKEDFSNAVLHLGEFEQRWPDLMGRMFTERIPFEGEVESIVDKTPNSIKTLIEFQT
jgi:glucose 1-dehydrogenase